LVLADAQPPEPAPFVRARPQRGVARPQPAHFPVDPPVFERGGDGGGEVGREAVGLPVELRAQQRLAFLFHGAQQLVEGVGEEFDPFVDQLVGSLWQ
jgi:hypothetical protein